MVRSSYIIIVSGMRDDVPILGAVVTLLNATGRDSAKAHPRLLLEIEFDSKIVNLFLCLGHYYEVPLQDKCIPKASHFSGLLALD